MNGAFYVGATGLDVQQRSLDAIAQNVTNMNTTAYKRVQVHFAELVSQPDSATRSGETAGIRSTGVRRDYEQGALRQTDAPLDLAIDGDGFLEVMGPGGQTYLWRGGALRVDADGMLVTADGLALKRQIQMPANADEIRIERDGRVRARATGEESFNELGKLELVMPDEIERLDPVSGGYFRADESVELSAFEPGEDGKGVFVQGALESSNVDLSTELVGMLLTQRAYGASAQVIQAGDQLMAIANGLRR